MTANSDCEASALSGRSLPAPKPHYFASLTDPPSESQNLKSAPWDFDEKIHGASPRVGEQDKREVICEKKRTSSSAHFVPFQTYVLILKGVHGVIFQG